MRLYFQAQNLFSSKIFANLSSFKPLQITIWTFSIYSASIHEYRPLKTKYGPNKNPIFFINKGPFKDLTLVFQGPKSGKIVLRQW